MKKAFLFGAGVFAGLVAWGILAALAKHHDVNWLGLLTYLLWWFLAWLSYSIGTIPFKRNASSASVFLLGALSGLIQVAFIKVAMEGSIPFTSAAALYTFFLLPTVVCSFFSPLVGRRNG